MKLAVVEAWHRALNAGDVEAVVGLTTADVEIAGPRGATRGHEVLRRWTAGAGVALQPTRWFCGPGDQVVVEQAATWSSGAGRTDPITVATGFSVEDGRIGRIVRHDDLALTMADAAVAWRDEVIDERG